ncbi:MAG: phage portal protein [Mogibacterium sp.]|nr:phage portal protein [Mogibacterium sp.]
MATSFWTRYKHEWNIFSANKDPTDIKNVNVTSEHWENYGPANSTRPDRVRLRFDNERTIVAGLYNKIAMDVSEVRLRHEMRDEQHRFKYEINSSLNDCLNYEANIDQIGSALVTDIVLSMFQEGSVAVVPVDYDSNPYKGSFDILSLRVAKIVDWYPEHIKVDLFNQALQDRKEITVPKKLCAIIENPLYAVMNQPNSTLQRLIRKLAYLDAIDKQSSSGKLDLLIQLPYTIKTDKKRDQAFKRKEDIEKQLFESKYGIAYIDGTERVTQLNRPAENNLLAQIEYLTSMLYNQLGLTEDVFKGTADAVVMNNYYKRTISPILNAIVVEMSRKWITKTARTQGQAIGYFLDPLKFVPVTEMAAIADSFTRNAIVESNVFRDELGYPVSDAPIAEELSNKNLYPTDTMGIDPNAPPVPPMDQGTGQSYLDVNMNDPAVTPYYEDG